MQTASINGAEIEYDVIGPDGGEPVLFLHGVLLGDSFRPVVDQPDVGNRHRCILYRRRGYAGSRPAPAADCLPEAAADARALLDHLGVERAHVVGHSWGGVAALRLAVDAPERVHSLALVEAALLVGQDADAYREALQRNVAAFSAADREAITDDFIGARWPNYRPTLDRHLPGAFAQAVTDAATVFERELPGLLRWPFGEAEARRVTAPTLSILGSESDALGRRFGDAHRFLVATLPDVEEIVLPSMTHLPQLQDPALTAETLVDFWQRHPLPAS